VILLSEVEIYESLFTQAIGVEALTGALAPNFVAISASMKETHNVLTKTEKQVIVGLYLGLASKEIAKARSSSSRTIEVHIATIKQKLNVKKLSGILLSTLFENCLEEGFD